MTYEFRADYARLSYGYDENFQPEYGFWQIIEGQNQNLLIHNKGLPYEKTYRIIELTDTSFIREYERVIYESRDTTIWPIGATALTLEIFEKRKGPCCDN